jgi:tRNA threonylcarbamoyladenosine biosynthesis protein TsaB
VQPITARLFCQGVTGARQQATARWDSSGLQAYFVIGPKGRGGSLILAIDSATAVLSLALHDGSAVIAERTWRAPGHHTVELSPGLHGMLEHAGVKVSGVQAIAVALGPGSYTGLRIGMSLAKGIALTCNPPIPLIGVPTLDIVAAAQPHQADWLWAVSQAGRGRVNAGLYAWQDDGWKAAETPILVSWAELAKRIEGTVQVSGEIDSAGIDTLSGMGGRVIIASPAQGLRRAGYLAEIGRKRFDAGHIDSAAILAPIYHH